MKIKNILFDLDGTLLPMDQEVFARAYFYAISMYMKNYGYNEKEVIDALMKGTYAMVKNDGKHTNEEVFWSVFAKTLGERVLDDKGIIDEFYVEKFDSVKSACGYNENAKTTIEKLLNAGYKLTLATNPIFPKIATQKRVKWAGLDETAFNMITTYENSSFCKPDIRYYEAILNELSLDPEECLMVGNDVREDMVANKLSMRVFLLDECVINKDGIDIDIYPHGGFSELLDYIGEINNDQNIR